MVELPQKPDVDEFIQDGAYTIQLKSLVNVVNHDEIQLKCATYTRMEEKLLLKRGWRCTDLEPYFDSVPPERIEEPVVTHEKKKGHKK